MLAGLAFSDAKETKRELKRDKRRTKSSSSKRRRRSGGKRRDDERESGESESDDGTRRDDDDLPSGADELGPELSRRKNAVVSVD